MKIGIAVRYEYQQKPARAVVYTNKLLEMLARVPGAGSIDGIGSGTTKDPYKPTTMTQWFGLSQEKPKVEPIFLSVGGRLIARWGTGAKKFANYCTDVTGDAESVAKATSHESDYETHIAKWGKAYAERDKRNGIDPDLPAYTRKALRVDHLSDRVAAAKSRLLLGGDEHACDDCHELASSLCSLLICEAYRAPATFIVSLMLLDLIETSTTYGKGGAKTYTWKSMLMHDVSGVPGRSGGEKTSGKHPMAGKGTADMGRAMLSSNGGNAVADRAISVMSVWLAHYLTSRNREYRYFILEGEKAVWVPQAKFAGADAALAKACMGGLMARSLDFGVKIGGTTVTYENLQGDAV